MLNCLGKWDLYLAAVPFLKTGISIASSKVRKIFATPSRL